MENKKYLRYCPNCTHYNPSGGACNYINENVMEYPERFIRYCDGKYLSLIEGSSIGPEVEEKIAPDDMHLIDDYVTVFAQNNLALFHIAKSLLDDAGIKYWSNAAYTTITRSLVPTGYPLAISVFPKDEMLARKVLGDLQVADAYVPKNNTDKKILRFVQRWGILLILLSVIFVLLMVLIFGR